MQDYVGTWWIADHRPESEIRKLDGVLTIDEHGRATLITADFMPLVLEPVGGLRRVTSRSASAMVVHGRLHGGGRMTLLHATGNTPTVRVAAAIEGIWLDPGRPTDVPDGAVVPADRRAELIAGEDIAAFTGIEVEIEHLSAWAAAPRLRMDVPRTPQSEPVPLLTQGPLVVPSARLTDGTTVSLDSRIRLQRHHRTGGTSVEVSEMTTARIVTPEPVSLTTLLGLVSMVRRLVGFALRREVGVLNAALIPADLDAVDGPLANRYADGHVRLPLHRVFLPAAHRDAPAAKPHRMLFTQADLPFAELLPRWAELVDELRGTVASLAAAHNTESLLENRLASAVVAAENLYAALAPAPACPGSRPRTSPGCTPSCSTRSSGSRI